MAKSNGNNKVIKLSYHAQTRVLSINGESVILGAYPKTVRDGSVTTSCNSSRFCNSDYKEPRDDRPGCVQLELGYQNPWGNDESTKVGNRIHAMDLSKVAGLVNRLDKNFGDRIRVDDTKTRDAVPHNRYIDVYVGLPATVSVIKGSD